MNEEDLERQFTEIMQDFLNDLEIEEIDVKKINFKHVWNWINKNFIPRNPIKILKEENKDYEQLNYTITPEMDEWMNAPMGKLVGCNNCYECLKDKMDESGLPTVVTRMIVCSICGNKRCPKATDHNLDCTNSNKSGQPGSRY